MSGDISSALIGLGGAVLAVVLSGILRTGRGERLHPGKLREYLLIRDAGLGLDETQRERLDFEIAWSTASTIGFPKDYDERMTPGENAASIVFAIATTAVFLSAFVALIWLQDTPWQWLGIAIYAVVAPGCFLFTMFVMNPYWHRRRYRRWLSRKAG